jgi:hypothetical protein
VEDLNNNNNKKTSLLEILNYSYFFHLFLITTQGALADIFLRGTNLMEDARGMASLVCG